VGLVVRVSKVLVGGLTRLGSAFSPVLTVARPGTGQKSDASACSLALWGTQGELRYWVKEGVTNQRAGGQTRTVPLHATTHLRSEFSPILAVDPSGTG